MTESMALPFRRNLTVPIVIGPAGQTPVAAKVPDMTGKGVTSFILINPNPFWFWFAGWKGGAGDMPNIIGAGHYIAPGEKYLGRTQMPHWVAAQADSEINFPIVDAQGNWLYPGQRTRFILIYGSGS